jgi:hypothetical protein
MKVCLGIFPTCDQQSKPSTPLPAICLCPQDFCSMVGLIFDVPVG